MRKKLTTEKFIARATKVHGDKYDYSLVKYTEAHTKVKIICQDHGVFEQTPNNHYKYGCNDCGIISTNFKQSKSLIKFINHSNIIHNHRYNYSKCVYINNNTDVVIICPIHNEFKQQPNNHINGQGCPECGKTVKANKKRLTTSKFIQKSKCKFGSQFDYRKSVYVSAKTPIVLLCNVCNNYISITPDNHYSTGCNKCLVKSIGELKIEEYLTTNNINYTQQHKFNGCKYTRKLPFDFYISERNCCIEYDGIQHYKPSSYFGGIESYNKLKIRDSIKTKFCEDNGIKLIRIPYTEFDNIESILKSEL